MITICEHCENSRKVYNSFKKNQFKKNIISVLLKMKEIYELKKRLDDFQNIATKIIQTDLLLQKYKEKESECEILKQNLINNKKYV
jgi:hypothetical protein